MIGWGLIIFSILYGLNMKNSLKYISLLAFTLVVSGCTLFSNTYQEETRRVIDYLLADMPIPDDADIQKEPTVILGTGSGIAGRIVLDSPVSPASNLIFYGNSTQDSGWVLSSSAVGEQIVLVYTKDERYATIEIQTQRDRLGTFFGGENNSQITISVVHPGAIKEQNPYLALDPSRSLEQGSVVLKE